MTQITRIFADFFSSLLDDKRKKIRENPRHPRSNQSTSTIWQRNHFFALMPIRAAILFV